MTLKAPFPYFGGKRRAAPLVWQRLGDVGGYIEPFAGSAAVLLARPKFTGRRVETLNDKDGLLVNFWRAITAAPDTVAHLTAGPVTEIDKVARNAYLLDWRDENLPRLYGDPTWFDPQAAAWWVYVMCAAIGNPFDGAGGWRSVECVDGVRRLVRLVDSETPTGGVAAVRNSALNLSGAGRGVHTVENSVPRLTTTGQGIHTVENSTPHLADAGQGIHTTTSSVQQWFHNLQKRLQHVRITCGDWTKPLRPSSINVTSGPNTIGIFLDPPYTTGNDIYDGETNTISHDVRQWCKTADPAHRIALCGYDTEHDELLDHGWTVETSKAGSSGYGAVKTAARERVWFSPACLTPGLW